jgi:pimeloyl-ACP methyl ester carboxylesterase
MTNKDNPTIVLVHGAFADGSSWAAVAGKLLQRGLNVVVPANELRGGAHDGEQLATVIRDIGGPVLLVGHSYGGVVITEAASRVDTVTGLVYITAFAPDEGETLSALLERFPASDLGPALVLDTSANPNLSIRPHAFPTVFAADVPAEQAAVLAVSQRPVLAAAFEEQAGPASWKSIPSHYLVATADGAIHPEAQRAMASRSESVTVEVEASHAVAVSQPDAVVDVIIAALNEEQK